VPTWSAGRGRHNDPLETVMRFGARGLRSADFSFFGSRN
jgi:hypothetical protein